MGHTQENYQVPIQEQTTKEMLSGTRRQFLRNVGLGSAAAMLGLATAGATGLGPLALGSAYARENLAGLTDLDILNFALGLEHLEATFYQMAVAGGKFNGMALQVVTSIRDHEVAHVVKLSAVITSLGGKPVAALAKYNFGDMSTATAILQTAETLEATGVGAYTGAAPLITDKVNILPAAASIEQVEARHFAAIRFLRGELPAPAAFGPSLSVAQVQAAIKPIVGS